MKYELDLFEKWVAEPESSTYNAGDAQAEAVRIKEVFLSMALSHKKYSILRRYFRLHREALKTIGHYIPEKPVAKKIKEIFTAANGLGNWMDDCLEQYIGTNDLQADDNPDVDEQKVITTFTMAELAVIIRLFIETGVFRVRNQKALTRFMSRNVVIRTKQIPETFSEEHLYNAMHSPAEPAMDRMQKVLSQMLAELNKLRRNRRKKESNSK